MLVSVAVVVEVSVSVTVVVLVSVAVVVDVSVSIARVARCEALGKLDDPWGQALPDVRVYRRARVRNQLVSDHHHILRVAHVAE